MFKKQIEYFKETSKIYEDIGEQYKAQAYRESYIKLQILQNKNQFKKDIFKDLENLCFENKFNELENLKFDSFRKKVLCFKDIFSEKTIYKINEIEKTGKFNKLEELKLDTNIENIIKLTKIFGVGPSTAKKLISQGITNYNKFKNRCKNLTKIQKLGKKYGPMNFSEPNITISNKVIRMIEKKLDKKDRVILAGSGRIKNKGSSDIDLIICNKEGYIGEIIKILEDYKILKDYVKSGPEDIMGVIKLRDEYFRIDIKCTTRKYLATYLLYFGSGKYFSKFIRNFAKEKGYKLNQYGIKNLNTGEIHTFITEKSVFSFLKLFYVQPIDRFNYW